MRPYDGQNIGALQDPTATTIELISGADFDGNGQEFYLRYLLVRNSGIAGVLELFDQNEAVAAAANKRFEVDLPAASTTLIELPAPGISFRVNITGGLTAAAGTVLARTVHAGGYLNGGM